MLLIRIEDNEKADQLAKAVTTSLNSLYSFSLLRLL